MFSPFFFAPPGGDGPVYVIGNSLKIDPGNSLSFNGPVTAASTPKTLSYWCKIQSPSQHSTGIFRTPNGGCSHLMSSGDTGISGTWTINWQPTGGNPPYVPGYYRDVCGWYHICIVDDGSTTPQCYVNGVNVGNLAMNNATIQDWQWGYNNFDGYVAECFFVDGTAEPVTTFADYNEYGVWAPLDPMPNVSNWGAGGFALRFQEPTNLGLDSSGNNNNFTATAFNITDAMIDSPTAMMAVGNQFNNRQFSGDSTSTFSNGALTITSSNAQATGVATMGIGPKTYAEVTINSASGSYPQFVLQAMDFENQYLPGYFTISPTGVIAQDGTQGAQGPSYTTGDVIRLTFDRETNTIGYAVNNGSFTEFQGPANIGLGEWGWNVTLDNNTTVTWNWGNRTFAYPPPAGFAGSGSIGLPDPIVRNGTDGFRCLTGPATDILDIAQGRSTAGTSFNPAQPTTGFEYGMWWLYNGDWSEGYNYWMDSVVGGNLSAGNPNTSQVPYDPQSQSNGGWTADQTVTAYCWSVDGPAETNTDGTISAQVATNKKCGFSIVYYQGDGNPASTVGHGLDRAPQLIITQTLIPNAGGTVKPLWSDTFPPNQANFCDTEGVNVTPTTCDDGFQGQPTDTVLTFVAGNAGVVNVNNVDNPDVAYCWHEVEGYSKFGEYVSNGQSGDNGPFIYCGFRPAWVAIKNITNTGGTSFDVYTTTLNGPYNPMSQRQQWQSNGRTRDTGDSLDFYTNGFKIRQTGQNLGENGDRLLYIAFAEAPVGGVTVNPAAGR